MDRIGPTSVVEHAAGIVAAYVSRNPLTVSEVPGLLVQVHTTLRLLGRPLAPPFPDEQRPAISIHESVSLELVFCLECGKSFQSIKRHLKADHQLSPNEYRQKWALPSDYPMVSVNYSVKRSLIAKDSGLGRQRTVPGSADRATGPQSARQ